MSSMEAPEQEPEVRLAMWKKNVSDLSDEDLSNTEVAARTAVELTKIILARVRQEHRGFQYGESAGIALAVHVGMKVANFFAQKDREGLLKEAQLLYEERY